jgi:hypothetical protein
MPCDTISTYQVKLQDSTDLDLLTKALEALNLNPRRQGHIIRFGAGESFNKATGEVRVRNVESVAEIKKAYSAELIKSQAKRFGWTLKQTGPYAYTVHKR